MATIRCPLRQAYEIAADKTACLDQKKQWIYYELEGLANQLTTVLRKQGIGEGDRVGLLVSNSVSAIAVLFALWRVKAVACPLNTRLPAGSSWPWPATC